jgi:hypothetical protein
MTDDERHVCGLFEYALTQLKVNDNGGSKPGAARLLD